MRDFKTISDAIIRIIEEESDLSKKLKQEIIEKILKIQKDSSYIAPEHLEWSWWKLAGVLNYYFDPSKSKWEEKIRKLFADEISVDEVE